MYQALMYEIFEEAHQSYEGVLYEICADLNKYLDNSKKQEINAHNMATDNMTTDLNRIKVVLVEKKKTNKWLAEQLGKDPATVSKWCTNTSQPALDMLVRIAQVLDVDVKELINSSKEDVKFIRVMG